MSSGDEEALDVANLLQQIKEYEGKRRKQVNCINSELNEPSSDCYRRQSFTRHNVALQEAKWAYHERKRQLIFQKYNYSVAEQRPLKRLKEVDCHRNRNSMKIQQKLVDFFSQFTQKTEDLIEQHLFQKYKYEKLDVFQRRVQIGYVPINLNNKKHIVESVDLNKLPPLGQDFEDAYKDQARLEQRSSMRMKKQQRNKQPTKNEYQITTQSEYLQTIFQQELYEDPIEFGDHKKSWAIVVRNVNKVGRFKAKYRNDFREFIRRLVYFAAKEIRRKHLRCQKYQKDFMLRARKQSKEAQSYWRKREKELIEMKKRKEKLEQERKKKEEEEREQHLQQRRLEFLMKQSDIYAHFMAKKLGITLEQQEQNGHGVDEHQAIESVQRIINENRRSLMFYDGPKNVENVQLAELKLDQYDQDTAVSSLIHPPNAFVGSLKEYQLKGLRWLDNLHEQGINGILADEMGLGKTIQAIALLSHISNSKHVWGPFLVIAPSSTLHNWQQEIRKFCPSLRVLPYWGQASQRKTIRKYFNEKNFGRKESVFHIVVTSYNLVVSDNKIFHRVKWQYMILDEAQAIKNINSQRWSILLSFDARNRLLLTGTPIQNTMGELWALLHFIMPKFFDSFEQFQEWFSKDIEAHSQDQKTLNQHQLQRLHSILQPFMLRRLKKDVENEIGQKREVQIVCQMTTRQAQLYRNIKSKLSIKEFFRMLDSKQKVDNLMNLVMQFRKICNHPELFERKPYRSPYIFQNKLTVEVGTHQTFATVRQRNPINYTIPKLVYDQLLDCRSRLHVFTAHYICQSLKEGHSVFSFIDLLKLEYSVFTKSDIQLAKLMLNRVQVSKLLVQLPQWDHMVITIPNALAQLIDVNCRSASFYNSMKRSLYNPEILQEMTSPMMSYIIPNSPEYLIAQSAKLLYLDKLLKELKQKQWRVLIFCQMTKMLDILEEYMLFRGYTYFRMDGQCQINDRRDMVNEFQSNDKIFAFLLSTRAGGLGITLTQADAVIFYDNDWNPTMDAQATDRAHRIGRTKDVYVYRLVTKGTIEERIVKRAQQKQNVQSTVYSGGFQGDKFKPQEVFELLFDEQEMDDTVTNKFMQKGQKKKKKLVVKKDEEAEEEDIIEVNLDMMEQNELDAEDAD